MKLFAFHSFILFTWVAGICGKEENDAEEEITPEQVPQQVVVNVPQVVKSMRKCSNCGEPGHNRATCPKIV